jgi:hypothetical protein
MFLRKKKINHQTAKDGLEAVEKWDWSVPLDLGKLIETSHIRELIIRWISNCQ